MARRCGQKSSSHIRTDSYVQGRVFIFCSLCGTCSENAFGLRPSLGLTYQAILPRYHEPFRVQVHPPSLGIVLRVGPRTILSQQELMQQTQRCACAECSRKTGAGIAHGVEFVLDHARMSMEPTFSEGQWKGAKRLSWNGRGDLAPTVRRHVC